MGIMSNDKKLTLRNSYYLLATGLGSGLSPIIPGTMGSLIALPIWYFLLYPILQPWYWLVIILSFLIGVFLCSNVSNYLKESDPGRIVWDEFVGMWITLSFLNTVNLTWIILAFMLFRIFDMWKPWPISWCDKNIKGGLGIMLDDVVAGVVSGILCVILHYIAY